MNEYICNENVRFGRLIEVLCSEAACYGSANVVTFE